MVFCIESKHYISHGFVKHRVALPLVVVFLIAGALQANAVSAVDLKSSAAERFSGAKAQTINISGKVTNEKGEPLVGAFVHVQNENRRALTDANGNYKISVAGENSVLAFSYVGFDILEIKVGDRRTIDAKLTTRNLHMEEVVVIGYGTETRQDLTGSIGTVDMDNLMKAPVGSFDEALAGRIAGVQVSSSDGQPGVGMDITIRGPGSLTQSTAPLYVIDGFPVEDSDNAAINPEEIESINVLKDASATAIYGSRGANGVIIIETKKGKEGKPVITFNSSLGYQQTQKRMEMMSTYEFVKYQLEISKLQSNFVAGSLYTPAELPTTHASYDPEGRTLEDYRTITGTDWQDLIFRNSPVHISNLAIRGGNETTKYAVSGSFFDQEGIILNTGARRYQGRATIDQTISDKLKMGLTANYSQNLRHGQVVNDAGNSFTAYVLYRAWAYRPVSGNPDVDLTEYDDDPDNTNASDIRINPLVSSENEYRKSNSTNFSSNAYVEYAILKNLKLRSRVAVRNTKNRLDLFYNSNTPRGSLLNRSNNQGVNGSFRYTENKGWSNENFLTYNNTYNRYHRLTLMGGFSYQENKSELFGFATQRVPNEELAIYGLGAGQPYSTETGGGEYALMSFFGRANYNFKSKYLLTATMRADGSSKFIKGNQWGYFPSAAFAWNMDKEKFMKAIAAVSSSKLRMSYGLTGNNRISNNGYMPNYGMPLAYSYSFNNGTPTQGIVIERMANRDLTWETTEQLDIGYDLGLYKNRIGLTVDFYNKITRDLLLDADMPISSGFPSVYKNVGTLQNRGWEFTLNTVNIQSESFTWESNFNISFNKNKVLKLADNQNSLYKTMRVGSSIPTLYASRVGYPAGLFYGYIFDGIYQYDDFDSPSPGAYILKKGLPDNGSTDGVQPGDIKYKDLNGDGTINDHDMTIIGNGLPTHMGGFSNNFSYKGLSLNVLLQWSYGNQIYNANRLIFEGNYINMFGVNQYASFADRWTPENPSNTLFKVGGQGPAGLQSTRVLEDGSYLRLKTVSLAYSFPKRLIQPLALTALDLRVSAQNLLTFTNYSGMDPEVSVRNSVLTPGFDYSAYPQARTITFGINATF
ncbi:TonB-dependent receptor [Parapedobacter sp. SGR-10]|nr:TonB-dependent receptor [Parapedobacter sp. SGR-10]